MATIKKLELKLKSGLLTELQSDTIFGHFAWRFKDRHGDEKLREFLQYFVDGNPVFTISDGFLEKNGQIYFPKPLKLTPQKNINKTKQEKVINFLKQKENKDRKLITLTELNYFLNGQVKEFSAELEKQEKHEKIGFVEDLRVSVEIDRNTLTSKKGNLFSYHPKYLNNDTSINIFIKILDEKLWDENECEDIIKDVFETGYGKKKSSGYGHFEILSFEDFAKFEEPDGANGFILLSQYLPSASDKITDAYYDINVKYGKFGEEKSNGYNPFKPAMLLMKPGSCFYTETVKEFYGRAVKGFSDYLPDTVHNGIAFILSAKL